MHPAKTGQVRIRGYGLYFLPNPRNFKIVFYYINSEIWHIPSAIAAVPVILAGRRLVALDFGTGQADGAADRNG